MKPIESEKPMIKGAKKNQGNIYSYFNTSALFIYQQREKALLETLNENAFGQLSDKRILDIGCGYGGILRDFINYGALPENCLRYRSLATKNPSS